MHGHIARLRIESRALAGNLLGDSHVRDVLAYVPKGADEGRRFPVVFVLPAYAGLPDGFAERSLWKPSVFEAFDARVAEGSTRPAILVAPDASTRFGGSQYVDSEVNGRHQTFLADELVPFVDRTLPTIPRRDARAVVGRSSGGFGALRLAMDRPDVVAAVGSHAGDAAFEITLRPMFLAASIAVARAGGAESFAASLIENGPRTPGEFDAAFVFAASAAYAPRPDREFPFVELPFDPATGALDHASFARWIEHDPAALLSDRVDALSSMRAIFLDAGDADEHGLHFAARHLARTLRDHDLAPIHEEFAGGHRGTSHRFEASLRVLVDALDAS